MNRRVQAACRVEPSLEFDDAPRKWYGVRAGWLVDRDAAEGRGLWQTAREADVFDGELHRSAACLGENFPDGYGHERAARDVGLRASSGEAAVDKAAPSPSSPRSAFVTG